MKIPSIMGLNRSPAQYFLESSRQGKTVQILGTIAFFSLIYYVASRFMQTDKSTSPTSQGPATLSNRVMTSKTPLKLKEITENTWKGKINCEKYGLDFTDAPGINSSALAKGLQALSERVENNMGITNIVIPKGLTLNKVVEIAKEYKVPVYPHWYAKIITELGDIPAEQTRVVFFTNSILKDTRKHTSDQHEADVTKIGKECGVAIQKPNVRDFMAFLVLTYLSSSGDARTMLYSSEAYTRLLEKVNSWSLFGGFAPSGLNANFSSFVRDDYLGVGASGSSEAIGTGNIGT